ncbi:DUF2971 domain-containing protein [Aeromonas veronii]|uniref:DUF2971 domain-containing protein n=1 Tax=Aeromonas TaxID=642 RepID=UPI003BA0D862
MDIIYHYTDLNAFLSIIKNKKLWLSAANNLNDYYEVDWFLNKIHKKLSKVVNDNNHNCLDTYWQMLRKQLGIPYICSFSKNGDLLSQWRAYADNGYGVAIGFNKAYFDFKVELPYLSHCKDHTIGITDVIYDESIQDKIIESYINQLKDFNSLEKAGEVVINSVSHLVRLSYASKNPAFAEENEVRIIHTPMVMGFEGDSKIGKTIVHGNISEMQHRVSGKRITSFFELDISTGNNDIPPISEIILGPKSKLSKYDIDTLLSLNGFSDAEYRTSIASYR